MIPYYTGASETNEPQRDPASSTGGFRSGTLCRSMEADQGNDPMVGVAIREVSGGNGPGVGSLSAPTADSLTWAAPGDATAGTAVAIAQGEEQILRGEEPGAYVRVTRIGANPLAGAHAVTCIDRINNLFPDVETDDAVAGLTTARALMLLNTLAAAATDFEAWVGEGDIEIDLEVPTAGELLGSGLSWSSATTEGAGPGVSSVAAAGELGLHIRRVIGADTAPSGSEAWAVRYSFTSGGVDYNGAIRGRYRIERTDYEAEGIWVGDGEVPDLEAAPDETWTSRPHTTSLGLTLPADIWVSFKQRNRWGMWGAATIPQRYTIDAGGDSDVLPPGAPTDITVRQTSGNIPTVGASYDAAIDGANRAAVWVIWLSTDGTTPDGTGTPDGYVQMQYNLAVDDLAFTSELSAQDDGTIITALVRTRRLDSAGGTAFSPDVIQLDASSTGTLKVDAEINDWDSDGYASITSPFGRLYEVIHYSGIVVADGQTTVTVDERALFGTTGTATGPTMIITPIVWTDSENTAPATWEIVAVAPGRPRGALLYGTQGAQAQDALTPPDGVTPVVLDADENVHLLLGEGWASLYIDTALVWRVLLNGDHGVMNYLYIPSEYDLINDDIVGAASGEGIIDAVDANTVYVCVRGQRRMKVDLSAMTITMGALSTELTLDPRAEQAGELARFGATMFLAWDCDREDYRPYMELDSDGLLTTAVGINQLFDTAEVEALW